MAETTADEKVEHWDEALADVTAVVSGNDSAVATVSQLAVGSADEWGGQTAA